MKKFKFDKSNFKLNKTTLDLKNSKFSFDKKSLVFKIPKQITSIIIPIMLVICLAVNIMLNSLVSNNVNTEISYISQLNSNLAQSYLENLSFTAQRLSGLVLNFKAFDKEKASAMLEKTLKDSLDNKDIFGAYFAFEPNAYFPSTPDGLSYYAFRDGASVGIDVLNNYKDYANESYYAEVKSSLKPTMTEPYSYTLSNGQFVFLVTVSFPILDDSGKFLGIASCDIETSVLSSLAYDFGGFKSAYVSMITGEGNYIAHTADSSKLGTNYMSYANADKEVFEAVQSSKSFRKEIDGGSGKVILNCHPVNVYGVDKVWSTALVVKKSEAMGSVRSVVILVSILSIVGILILAFFIFAIMRKALLPIGRVIDIANEMDNGNLNMSFDDNIHSEDEIGKLMQIFQNTSKNLHAYISDISYILDNIANGNLEVEVDREYVGDFHAIKDSLNNIIASLNHSLTEMQNSSKRVAVNSSQVSQASQSLAQGATEQASSIEELSATIEDMSEKIKHNADNASVVSKKASEMGLEMNESSNQMDQLMAAMKDIDSKSNEISNIVKTIEDIAFQTNILALNAAVEAARAGVAGKGFAVVADEVRNLASKSGLAAQNISELIESSVDVIKRGTSMANKTSNSLAKVVNDSQEIVVGIDTISDSLQKESDSISQISVGVDQIAAVVQTNSANAEESAAASQELFAQSQTLDDIISQFKIKN